MERRIAIVFIVINEVKYFENYSNRFLHFDFLEYDFLRQL